MKPIVFTEHALRRMRDRKASQQEVEESIGKTPWFSAEQGRFTSSCSFPFGEEHYGRYYRTKEVVPIFVEEAEQIVVITVYTFFSQK